MTVTVDHTHVFAALISDCVNRPSDDLFEHQLDLLRKDFASCPEITCSPSFSPSQGASQSHV